MESPKRVLTKISSVETSPEQEIKIVSAQEEDCKEII